MTKILNKRDVSLDLLRVLACLMVIQIHVGEAYYIGEGGKVIHGEGVEWVGWLNSLARCSIALFVMISGYFLLPMKENQTTELFFKRRFIRILIPFFIWCALYAVFAAMTGTAAWDSMLPNILRSLVNYGTEVGHLWYIYMLLGLYLLVPVLSPWMASASKKDMNYVLCLWLFSSALCYIHLVFPNIWGECFWNPTPLLYYFTGFGGFFVLGGYMRRFYPVSSVAARWWAVVTVLVGYLITVLVFQSLTNVEYVPDLELSWGQTTINVAMMAIGLFILVRAIRIENKYVKNVVCELSEKSFGIYLAHIMVMNLLFDRLDPLLVSYPIKILIITSVVFLGSYIVVKLLSYLPKSNWLLG